VTRLKTLTIIGTRPEGIGSDPHARTAVHGHASSEYAGTTVAPTNAASTM
jgi:hypothetical protein